MIILAVLTTLILIGITGIAIVNTLTFPKLTPGSTPTQQSLISILIPARNEAAVIAQTVRGLLNQNYPNFEIILLDDNSTDDTAAIARTEANGDTRLRVLTGQPLPNDWLGKNWACHQLAQQASGDWLIFTDADVHWSSQALQALVAEATRTRADLLTVWPSQDTRTWGERLVVSLMSLVVMGYLPLPLVHYTPWATFAAANGQCLAFRRSAYQAIGGHTPVQHEVLEDVLLARHVKAAGFKLRMVNGNSLISCRMYTGWPAVRDGFAKNILAGYGGRVSFLLLATLFHWLIFLLPWLWLALGWRSSAILPGWPLWPLLLIGMGVGVRALTAAATGQRVRDALLLPVSVLLMTRIAAQAIWWQWRYGGPRWKGRTITPATRGLNG